jgi:hypothetical protein
VLLMLLLLSSLLWSLGVVTVEVSMDDSSTESQA